MTNPSTMSADIFVSTQLAPEREELIVDALTALGVSARVRVLPPRRGVGDLQWLVLVALPLQAFLTSLGSKIADDAYQGFQRAVRRLLHRVAEDQVPALKPVVLQDATSGIQVVLDPDLSVEGYKQLLHLDLSQFRFGPVHYDQARQRWRSELDEA
jgi:hypothetical protein